MPRSSPLLIVAMCLSPGILLAPGRAFADEPAPHVTGLPLEKARVTVTGFDVNRPDPYPGIGDFGWAGNIQRLADGRLMLVHQWGYWHSSFAQPRDIEPELARRWRAAGWPLDFPAPTGGRSMATFSADNGKTWSKPRTILDLPQDDGPYGLLRCTDGTLLCFINVQASWYGYDQAPAAFSDQLDGLNTNQCVIRSTDDGRTWSEPVWLKSPGHFYQRSHAQPIQLPDGGILWPTYCLDSRDGLEFCAIHRSDDSGKTWHLASTIRRDGKSLDEPALARLPDGRLILVGRPDGAVFHCNDNAATWTETARIPAQGTLKAPRLFVLADGTVVCVASITGLDLSLSRDAGRTWTAPVSLDPASYGYAGGYHLEDGSLLISYVSRPNAPSRIHLLRLRVNDERDRIELLPPS